MHVEVQGGLPWYNIFGLDRPLHWSDVFHARYFLPPGSFVGIGAIEAHRRSLTQSRVLMEYGQNSYSSGAVPPVVIKVNKPELDEGEAEYIQQRWMARHASGNRLPAVVPGIMDISPIGMSMQDAEYLSSRKFNVAEIAYMFNLAPEDLGVTAGEARALTYQNLEQATLQRLVYTMQPIMSRIEQTFRSCLPGSKLARFITADILRTDFKTRMEGYAIAIKAGVMTVDEVRALEKARPLTPAQKAELAALNAPRALAAPKDNDTMPDEMQKEMTNV
jgi:HK97 family phage portal protein